MVKNVIAVTKENKRLAIVIVVLIVGILFCQFIGKDIMLKPNQKIGDNKEFPVFYSSISDGTTNDIKSSVDSDRYFAVIGIGGRKPNDVFTEIFNKLVDTEISELQNSEPNYSPGDYFFNGKVIHLNSKNRYDEIKKIDGVSDNEIRDNIANNVNTQEILNRDIFKFENIIVTASDYQKRFVTKAVNALFNRNINNVVRDERIALNKTDISLYEFLKSLCKNNDGYDFIVNFNPSSFSFNSRSVWFRADIFEGYVYYKIGGNMQSHKIKISLDFSERYNIESGENKGYTYSLDIDVNGHSCGFDTLKDIYLRKTGKIL